MCKPSFLPEIIALDGTWEDTLEYLYEIYQNDIKSGLTLNGLRVVCDNRILSDGQNKEEGFWHLISKKDKKTNERLPDFRRAERLVWIKPLINNIANNEVNHFDYEEGSKDKGIRTYVWLEHFNFIVILKKSKNWYVLITSFYITSKYFRDDIKRKYRNRIKDNDRP